MGHRAIDQQRPEGQKHCHGAEFHALGKCPGDQRGSNNGEHQLVDHVGLLGNGGSVAGVGREAHAAQKHVLQAADEAVAMAEGQRVAHQGPEDGDQPHHGEALHHGGQDVFAAHQAAIEKRQAGPGHQQHQRGRGQHPRVVAGRLSILDGLLQRRDLRLGGWGICSLRLRRGSLAHCEGRKSQEESQKG